MTFPYGSPEAHYEAVVAALADRGTLAPHVITVTRYVAKELPYETRHDIERAIAGELFHGRVEQSMESQWAELNIYLGGLP